MSEVFGKALQEEFHVCQAFLSKKIAGQAGILLFLMKLHLPLVVSLPPALRSPITSGSALVTFGKALFASFGLDSRLFRRLSLCSLKTFLILRSPCSLRTLSGLAKGMPLKLQAMPSLPLARSFFKTPRFYAPKFQAVKKAMKIHQDFPPNFFICGHWTTSPLVGGQFFLKPHQPSSHQYHQSLCTKTPPRSFGSNQVHFGGINRSASATASS